MQFLAIDLGDKRTGLAVGDAVTRTATPLDVLEVPIAERGGDALLDALAAAIREQFSTHAKVELVIGLPLNMEKDSESAAGKPETEGPRARMVRTFGARIAERTGRRVHFQDERLSSAAADWTMAQSGLTHKQKKHRRDALAAAGILADFLRGWNPGQS